MVVCTIPQVGAQTETELKEKKLRVEDALNATKAAVEEGIVIGGGCTLLKLAAKVDAIKDTLPNDEQKVRLKSGCLQAQQYVPYMCAMHRSTTAEWVGTGVL